MLEIRLLGGFSLSREGMALDLPKSRQARALLAYLVCADKSFTREHLCNLLWDTPSDPKAALRWSLTKLRPLVDETGSPRLVADGDRIGFNRAAATLDISRVESHCETVLAARGPEAERLTLARAALAWCGGSFLEGLELGECPAFQSWCLAQREKYRSLTEKLHAAVAGLLADTSDALPAAQAWVACAPASEAAHAAVMRAFQAAGRIPDALEQYRRYDSLRKREGGAPGTEIETLRRGLTAQPRTAQPAVAVPAAAPAPPLVGREEEMRRMRGHVDGLPGALLLIRGEPGLGKTSLLTACLAELRNQGHRVRYGVSHRSESMRVYGPWLDALAGDPVLDVFAGSREAGAEGASAPHGFFERFAAALTASAEPGRPQVFLFDDVQWMDPASLALLHFCLRRRVPASFLAAARDQDMGAGSAREFRNALLRESMLDELLLPALDPEALRRLLGKSLDTAGQDAVIARSGGNPLFALELARTGGAASGTLESIIDSQLEKLGPAAQGLLPWMAALDRNLHLDLLARVSGSAPAPLIAGVEDLEKAGLVVPASHAGPTAPELAFRHELFRQAAYARISAPRLRLIHRHIAAVMREFFDDLEIAERARHAELGEDWDGAMRDYTAAAKRAFSLFAYQETVDLSLQAIQAAQRTSGDSLALKLDTLRLLMNAELITGRFGDYVALSNDLVREARGHSDRQLLKGALASLAGSYYQTGQWKEMGDAAMQAVAMQPGGDSAEAARHLGDMAACFLMTDQDIPRAEAMLRQALDICETLDAHPFEVLCCEFMLARHAGDLETMQKTADMLAAASLERRDYFGIFYGGLNFALELLLDDCPAETLAILNRTREYLDKVPEGGEKTFHGVLDVFTRRLLGEAGLEEACADGLEALRKVDAKTYFAHTALLWSDLEKGSRPEAVKSALQEALAKMEMLGRPTESTLLRVKLARLEQEDGHNEAAQAQIRPILPDLAIPKKMSKRAVDALFSLAMELGLEIPTPITTRVTTTGS